MSYEVSDGSYEPEERESSLGIARAVNNDQEQQALVTVAVGEPEVASNPDEKTAEEGSGGSLQALLQRQQVRLGKTAVQMAKHVGMSISSWKRLAEGITQNPRVGTMNLLHQTLGIEMRQLAAYGTESAKRHLKAGTAPEPRQPTPPQEPKEGSAPNNETPKATRSKFLLGVMTDTGWMRRANCKEYPVETFFASDGVGVEIARRICADCPVKAVCLEYAVLNRIDHGVWGGASVLQRKRLARQLGVPDKESPDGWDE